MITTIHQSMYLPWLGFFDKVKMADLYVIMDNVQFEKNYFYNRNKIRVKSEKGWQWITIPVKCHMNEPPYITDIKDVKIDNSQIWAKKQWKAVEMAYQKATYFDSYSQFFKKVYEKKWENLADINFDTIMFLFKELGICCKVMNGSELKISKEFKKSDLVHEICRLTGTTKYIAGKMSLGYLDETKFKRDGIQITYQNYTHPAYEQLYKPFIPYMSIIDLLFNHGEKSMKIILEGTQK